MKNLLFFIFLIVLLWACDPSYSTEYSIVNETEQNAKVTFFDEDTSGIESAGGVYHYRQDTASTRTLEKSANLLLFMVDNDLAGSPALLTFEEDSIFVIFETERAIRFYPDSSNLSSGRNIYNVEEDWEATSNKNNYTYTFRITQEDLADVQN